MVNPTHHLTRLVRLDPPEPGGTLQEAKKPCLRDCQFNASDLPIYPYCSHFLDPKRTFSFRDPASWQDLITNNTGNNTNQYSGLSQKDHRKLDYLKRRINDAYPSFGIQ